MSSPFLRVPPEKWITHNELAFAIWDKDPVTPGHALVIPKREVRTFFNASRDERMAAMDLVEDVCQMVGSMDAEVEGFNIGTNAGKAAGQTIMHWHTHIIPRRPGDTLLKHGGGIRLVLGTLTQPMGRLVREDVGDI